MSDGSFESLEDLWEADSQASSPGLLDMSGSSQATFRTYFVFRKLPKRVEFRVPDMPLLLKDMKVMFDLWILNPRNPNQKRHLLGHHHLVQIEYTYGGKYTGMTQYCHWE